MKSHTKMTHALKSSMKKALFIVSLFVAATQNLPLSNASLVQVKATPPFSDEWCKDKCSSLDACNTLYRRNFVDLRLRVGFSINDGPGRRLVIDKYFGTTISRQSFETQFILDVARALETSPCRLYILNVFPEEGSNGYWDSERVIITFRLFPADSTFVATLTKQIQEPQSHLYEGQVTRFSDPLFGLVALQWDFSLKLLYSISIVGAADVIDSVHGKYLNQGSLQACVLTDQIQSKYCIFEGHLIDDIEKALQIESGKFIVLFIKDEDRHSVVVTFRLVPNVSSDTNTDDWVNSNVEELIRQISDPTSSLYSGNVTFKIDSTWGISGISKQPRQFSKYLSQPAPSTSADAYERCKATHRCPRGWSHYDQSTAQSSYTFQEYYNGKHVTIPLFLSFEDWRQGTRGWEQSCRRGRKDKCLPAHISAQDENKPMGAHWSPFDFDSLGPNVPTFGKLSNNGLVLNKETLEAEIADQSDLIGKYEAMVNWTEKEFQHHVTGNAMLRSRDEIKKNITNYTNAISKEKEILTSLLQSQCSDSDNCDLLFNTSNAILSGAVNSAGIITTTPDGTEVALWAFDSIDIDENVNVVLTGQRAMALVSRSSVRINTALNSIPGTLGGFPGGFSVGRRSDGRFVRVCDEGVDSRGFLDICKEKGTCCPGDQPIGELENGITSNNINGPGSPSTRVYLITIQTSAPAVDEIQLLTTKADIGQTLSGGFRLEFNGYVTPFLPHDITASELKRKMEDSLNPVKRNQLANFDRQNSTAGLGVVGVTRESFGTSGGYQWKITFSSAVGKIGKDSSRLSTTNLLVSKGASVTLETLQHGNSIGGTFALRFLGKETRPLSHDISANEMKEVLLEDITILSAALVLRSDPTENCNDGFCANGPGKSGGYIWTLTLNTQIGNISPFSPTSNTFDNEGKIETMTAVNFLTGCINLKCPTIQIESSHVKSHNREMRNIATTKPFSLAYGGAGAGHGGEGGDGFNNIQPGEAYGNITIPNLHGGSGGGVGVYQPFQLGMFKKPRGRGGSGGGAIEIIAANDIILGSNAVISCDGESGADGFMLAGGGGSGGTILLAAGGAVEIDGSLSVAGGAGGQKKTRSPKEQKVEGHGGAGAGGRMAFYGQSVVLGENSSLSLLGGNCSAGDTINTASYNCTGDDGTLFVEAGLDAVLSVDRNIGAAGTKSSLFLRPRMARPPYDSRKFFSSTHSGPEFDLKASRRPPRVSFYFRLANASKSDWDASFELRDARWSYLSSKTDIEHTAVVGFVLGKEMRHGTNYFGIPFDDGHIKKMKTIQTSTERNKWTKVDIRFDWKNGLHDIFVDDIQLIRNSPFNGESIRSVSISNYYEGSGVWFDEIFIGEDTTMDFRCPALMPDGSIQMNRPLERGWKAEDIGGDSSIRPMQRHESHVSQRPVYQREDHKYVVPFDGEGSKFFTSDVKFRHDNGDRFHREGNVLAGSILRLPDDVVSDNDKLHSSTANTSSNYGMHPSTYIWYGEHDHLYDPMRVSGAIMACSTQDFVTWRNEGAMLHYTNITDMVNGSDGPFHLEKPKVLYNNFTDKFVMWMIIDNGTRDLGMAGVAVSDNPNGPFEFVRSLYPDGNQTRDQTLFQDDDGAAYLIRTYYYTTEYVLPKAVMQPTWESVKNADGTINFALSYHRAEYEPLYDDYHDIYLQRWRTEDRPWKVICVNRSTGKEREVPYGKEHLNHDGEVCHDPFEYKKVLGQGNPLYENSKHGISSRFLDPENPANNEWVPDSVPGVKGQTWNANYKDGTCGKQNLDDDIQFFDPALSSREQPNRGNCSNIVDNPTHPTLPDRRMGPQTVIEKRRAKYIAVSRLTDDYLDTSGILTTYEGELEDGADLLSLVQQFRDGGNPFGWKASKANDMGTTFQSQIHDDQFTQIKNWALNHHQHRSFFSPACVFDGQCPNNFK